MLSSMKQLPRRHASYIAEIIAFCSNEVLKRRNATPNSRGRGVEPKRSTYQMLSNGESDRWLRRLALAAVIQALQAVAEDSQ